MNHYIASMIAEFVDDLPVQFIEHLVEAIRRGDSKDWQSFVTQVCDLAPQPLVRAKLQSLLANWRDNASALPPSALALAIESAYVSRHYHPREQIELVWSGPEHPDIPLRRTDQALLQVIHAAQHSLKLVSFAVYTIPRITEALIAAANRGVPIQLYLETPDESDRRINYDTIGMLGSEVIRSVQLYVWPREQRPLSSTGRPGALHAKLAIADSHLMLISSANLTEYAMSLNVEAGVLIHGGNVPKLAEEQLQRLVEGRIFQRLIRHN